MEAKQIGNTWIIRIRRGEEIIATLTTACRENHIRLGIISAIGAVGEATIGLYDVSRQQYHSESYSGDMEIVCLTGNVTTMHGEIYLHLHVSLSDVSHNLIGGHLNRAVVSATCEVFIQTIPGEIDRFTDDETGLNLLKL
ncbi:DNA-binding protein [bacterium]|nr:DNA-binding protein [candidate division CSSED10-310 bacterium]